MEKTRREKSGEAMIRFSKPKFNYYPRGRKSHTIEMFSDDRKVGEMNFSKVNDKIWEINNFDIYSTGEGFGRILITHFESLAKRSGVDEIVLESVTPAMGFWDKMGYRGEGNRLFKNFAEVGAVWRR